MVVVEGSNVPHRVKREGELFGMQNVRGQYAPVEYVLRGKRLDSIMHFHDEVIRSLPMWIVAWEGNMSRE